MDIIKSIQQRSSCRTFTSESLQLAHREMLVEFINNNKTGINGEVVDFIIVENNDANKHMRLDYGLIKGNKTYLLGKTNATQSSRVNYGYLIEKMVLKATDLKIATCWIGIFDKEYFSDIQLENELEIPSIIILGYANKKTSLQDKLVRLTVKAAKRHPWEYLFFDYTTNEVLNANNIPKYMESLEMIRLAPSAGNAQPWRIFHSAITNEFHFYKKPIKEQYEAVGMHDVDMGIAMCHFELVSVKNGLKGKWLKHEPEKIKPFNELQYISTWRCE